MSKLIPISTTRTLEDAAHFFDIQQRAKLARPVEQGRDILKSVSDEKAKEPRHPFFDV